MRELRRLCQRLSDGSNRGGMILLSEGNLGPSAGKGKAGCQRVYRPVYPALPFFYSFIVIFFLAAPGLFPADLPSPLPVIPALDSRDLVFKQYLLDVEAGRRLVFSSRPGPAAAAETLASSITIYSYKPRNNEEFLGIAARCSIPHGTLATLNRFSHAEDMVPGKLLLLSSIPGIFIPEKPETALERLLSFRPEQADQVVLSIPREGKTERFRFIPGDDFSPAERVFFLNRGFRFPLDNFQVSSFYGPRVNPVTGISGTHRGLDLAAPEGAEVYAVKNGTVMDLGEDPVLGKYVILSHENNWISLYGHLSEIKTALHQEVQSTNLIARVGSTGQSTGPHLHFELRQNGQTRDPARLLGLFKGNSGR